MFVRRFLADYARNPVNLLLLRRRPDRVRGRGRGQHGRCRQAARRLGGPAVETAAAGWAAAFLAGIAMYFQTAATRETDRRVVIAGLPASTLVAGPAADRADARAWAPAPRRCSPWPLRTGIDHPARAVAGTLMFAVIYVAVGAVVSVFARNPVNGTVIVLFVWILDVFFGPAMGAADRPATRGLPTHFVTLWMVDLPSRHGGRPGDLGWAVLWTVAAVLVAWVCWPRVTRTAQRAPRNLPPGSVPRQLAAAAPGRLARRPAQPGPVGTVRGRAASCSSSPPTRSPRTSRSLLTLREHGSNLVRSFAMPAVHGATMAPIAIASLAALVGLFVRAGQPRRRPARRPRRPAHRRAAHRPPRRARACSLLAATPVSLAATALVFDAARWPTYAAANILLGFTYGLIGALLAPLFGRVGGVFLAFLLPVPRHRHRAEPDAAPGTHHAVHGCCPGTAAPAYSSTARSPAASTRPAPC